MRGLVRVTEVLRRHPRPRVRGIRPTGRVVDLLPGTRVRPIGHNDGDLQAGHLRAQIAPQHGDVLRYRVDHHEVSAIITWSYPVADVDGHMCGWVITERNVVA